MHSVETYPFPVQLDDFLIEHQNQYIFPIITPQMQLVH